MCQIVKNATFFNVRKSFEIVFRCGYLAKWNQFFAVCKCVFGKIYTKMRSAGFTWSS